MEDGKIRVASGKRSPRVPGVRGCGVAAGESRQVRKEATVTCPPLPQFPGTFFLGGAAAPEGLPTGERIQSRVRHGAPQRLLEEDGGLVGVFEDEVVFPADGIANAQRGGGKIDRVCATMGLDEGGGVEAIAGEQGVAPSGVDGLRFVEFKVRATRAPRATPMVCKWA